MERCSRTFSYLFLLLPVLLLYGCQGSPVPHLTGDVIMLEEGMSKKEVKAYLGEPNSRQEEATDKQWIYTHVDKDLLRKTPLIGGFMGSATVNIVTVHFRQDKVTGFSYQTMTPKQYKKEGYRRND